jgi:hypothetical protein
LPEPALITGMVRGISLNILATCSAKPSMGWRMTMASKYWLKVRTVSSSDSPLTSEEVERSRTEL